MIETFLQAQAEAMAGHARTTAAQQFPAYTGEGKQTVDDGFALAIALVPVKHELTKSIELERKYSVFCWGC